MNNTKWDEIFKAFYLHQRNNVNIYFRKKLIEKEWDFWENDWEHFGSCFAFYKDIEYLQIELTNENRQIVLDILHVIHVPGETKGNIVTIFGYQTSCEYL